MSVEVLSLVGSGMMVQKESYFLGGEQRTIFVNEEARISIIPQPNGMGIHSGLFEIAKLRGERIEVVETYCTEEQVQRIIGEMVLSGGL